VPLRSSLRGPRRRFQAGPGIGLPIPITLVGGNPPVVGHGRQRGGALRITRCLSARNGREGVLDRTALGHVLGDLPGERRGAA